MTGDALRALAAAAGLAFEWTDYRGQSNAVSPDTLRAILAAMDLPAGSAAEITESRRRLSRDALSASAPLVTAEVDQPVEIRTSRRQARLIFADGGISDIRLTMIAPGLAVFRAPAIPGYHILELDDRNLTLAVAPKHCWRVEDAAPGRRLWGLGVQIYSLRGGSAKGFGDFAALGAFAEEIARAGADALAVSPTHALFAADPNRYAPYGPSTRLYSNVLYADMPPADGAADEERGGGLIDWPQGATRKLTLLRKAYDAFRANGPRREFEAFVAGGGERLLSHARFEALDARFRPAGFFHWRDWPDGFSDAASARTRSLKPDDPEVEFHLFMQWLADRGLAGAQDRARAAGMAIGLIADLAVGMDGAGSHAWSRPGDLLHHVSIGAPPDLLGPNGQSWGLTTFSPMGLRATGFAGFLETLRAAMRHAGGVRIDHAMGLQRLWIVPDGAGAGAGAYLSYPVEDLLRLIALESHNHRAIVLGEDLGTVPYGFRERSTDAGMMGLRVLWFERTRSRGFKPPPQWDADAVAMTTTHDLPTIAGWWRGRDIDWRTKISGDNGGASGSRSEREADKAALWATLRQTGCAAGDPPEPDRPDAVIAGALRLIGGTPCRLAIVPVDDIVGEVEQPNLPGTIDEHPNWRRRLPPGALSDRQDVAGRLSILNEARAAP